MITGLPCKGKGGQIDSHILNIRNLFISAWTSDGLTIYNAREQLVGLLTADVHMEEIIRSRILVTGRELIDPTLGAEDPH